MSAVMMRAIAIVIAVSGCSLLVNSSIDGLHCFDNKSSPNTPQCEESYSCDGDQCVADGSLAAGTTCSKTQQCAKGLVCPPGIYICRQPCQKIYQFNTGECGANQVCAPVYDTDGVHFSGGACVDTECATGADADTFCQTNPNNKFAPVGSTDNPATDNRCVRLAANGGLCLESCVVAKRAVDVGGGGATLDQCLVDTRGNKTHCGIINNTGGAPDYVCMPSGAATAGQNCALFPASGSGAADACSVNTGGEPLVCMANDGSLTGQLQCQQVCLGQSDCTGNNQICTQLDSDSTPTNNTNFSYCSTVTGR